VTYERASGQKLNREKTSVFFSINTSAVTRSLILVSAGVSSIQRYEKYLGLSALVGRSKVSAFSSIKGRIWDRICGWKEKFLSQAGKEIMLKAVIQAIPTYAMSVFLLPKTLCHDINSMMSKFWWGHKENDSKMVWMSWEKLGRAKEKGGIGFRDLKYFNLALLAKQGWRLIHNTDSLVAKVFKEKYYPHASFQTSVLGNRPSYAWRSIHTSKSLLQAGMMWRMGDGRSIKIWEDWWIPSPSTYSIQSPVNILEPDAKVCSLIDEDTRWWNKALVGSIFSKEEVDIICSMPICPLQQHDRMVWAGSVKGDFSVKSAYHFAKSLAESSNGSSSSMENVTKIWKEVWRVKGPRVLTTFLWKACANILPTRANLCRRGVVEDPICPICKLEPETVSHALRSCSAASAVWRECPPRIQKCVIVDDCFLNIFNQLQGKFGMEELQVIVITARLVWLWRNEVVFGGEFWSPLDVVRCARKQLEAANSADQGRRDALFQPTVSLEVSWKAPSMGTVKANWDVAVDWGGGKIGIGVVVRDSLGKFVAALAYGLPSIMDPTCAEAYGVWKLAEFCSSEVYRTLEVEGDALEIVQELHADSICRSSYGHLVEGTKQLLNMANKWEAKHVRRFGNTAAHLLAHFALSCNAQQSWYFECPSCIQETILVEQDLI
jgi:hypothetical protein